MRAGVRAERVPVVFAYHGVDEVSRRAVNHELFVAPAALSRHIRWLRRWGYTLTTFGRIVERAREGSARGLAALTFDDGYRDNLEVLAPLLERERAPATVFVVSEWLGLRHPDIPWKPMLTSAEVLRLAGYGIEIGSHTASHPDLRLLAYDAAFEEFERSRRTLESILQSPVTVAAYPYGLASSESRAACRAAGYAAACRFDGGGSWDDPFDVPRQPVGDGTTLLGLYLKRNNRYETSMRGPLELVRRARRHVLHALARTSQ
jgi:peptidoglycan/xylan/chitin deacetylase (PgdA/CDA1 family)